MRREFFDSDQELEARTGASVSLIFDIEGEAGFRAREKQLIDELTQLNDIVLATGGGAILDVDNRKVLSSRGFVVYLWAPIDQLFERTRLDTTRPLLQTEDPASRMKALLAEREPLYRKTADLVIDTHEMPLGKIVKTIRDAAT
jgi:shikimate kinase